MTFPLNLEALVGKPLMFLVFGLIGFAFGFVLESSGFGNSKKLAAQFYFKDMTVLKVMFGAIITAMVLIFLMVGLGVLDYNQIWVNPTYLWSGIVGGLIMGVGFIVGGFCPGTSLVGMATGKIDGLLFVLGGLFGIFLFGETEQFFDNWWQTSGYLGRFTLMDWLKVPTGVIVLAIVVMAVLAFFAAEQLEKHFGKRDLNKEPKKRAFGAIALIGLAALVILIGTPTTEEKWDQIAAVKEPTLANREVQIEPAELYKTLYDNRLKLTLLDVRNEADYNLFHIRGAQNVAVSDLKARIPGMLAHPVANGVTVVVSNDEATATQAWKVLTAESVPNVYILGGGINGWIDKFGKDETDIMKVGAPVPDDQLQYIFPAALGDRYECADPNPIENEELEFTAKIKLQMKRDKSGGGCG
jgi:rhodanese-related sulfurtransferase/uncharacterized membrane protein (DUF485 family)